MKQNDYSSQTINIVEKLNQMYDTLDNIQELWQVQDSQELMNELGKAMGHIDNTIDVIKKNRKD